VIDFSREKGSDPGRGRVRAGRVDRAAQGADAAGADTSIVSLKPGAVRAWKFTDWGERFPVDMVVERADPAAFDALLLPGGVINPDTLRMNQKAMSFIRHFFDRNKPVASICHGPWSIIEAGAARGRRMTSWPSLRTDLLNAGAEWVDADAVVDRNMVTSRKPDDIPAFNGAMVALFANGKQAARHSGA
jgi:protease I